MLSYRMNVPPTGLPMRRKPPPKDTVRDASLERRRLRYRERKTRDPAWAAARRAKSKAWRLRNGITSGHRTKGGGLS